MVEGKTNLNCPSVYLNGKLVLLLQSGALSFRSCLLKALFPTRGRFCAFFCLWKCEWIVCHIHELLNLLTSWFQPTHQSVSPQLVLSGLQEADPVEQDLFQDVQGVQDWVVNVLDNLLEHADRDMDQAQEAIDGAVEEVQEAWRPKGTLLEDLPVSASALQTRRLANKSHAAAKAKLWHADSQSYMQERPQLRFDDAPDNSNTPFRPKLSHWGGLQGFADGAGQVQVPGGAAPFHPLRETLDSLRYPPAMTQASSPRAPMATPWQYVDTAEQLEEVVERLEGERELAVDLEAHSKHSFQGFCCLMQISTRKEDLLIDALALRSHLGPMLGPLFANPQVVKVLHGADSDVVWLQRDFGIYVAGLFDTGQAARVLGLESYGLAHLLQRYCNVKANKKYQMADWRKELAAAGDAVPPDLAVPIPEGRPRGALGTVLERSRRLSLTVYEKPLFTDTSYRKLWEKWGLPRASPDKAAFESRFAALYAWRDRTARVRDESSSFVMSPLLLTDLAVSPPASEPALKTACRRRGSTAPIVEELAEEVLEVLEKCSLEAVPEEPMNQAPAEMSGLPSEAGTSGRPASPVTRRSPVRESSASEPAMVQQPPVAPQDGTHPILAQAQSAKTEPLGESREGPTAGGAAAPPPIIVKRKAGGAFGGPVRRRVPVSAPPVPTVGLGPCAAPAAEANLGVPRQPLQTWPRGPAPVETGGAKQGIAAGEAARRAALVQSTFVAPFTFAPRDPTPDPVDRRVPAAAGTAPGGTDEPGPQKMSGVEVRAALNAGTSGGSSSNRFQVLADQDGEEGVLHAGWAGADSNFGEGEDFLPLPILPRKEWGDRKRDRSFWSPDQRGKRPPFRVPRDRGRGRRPAPGPANRSMSEVFHEAGLTSGSDSGDDGGSGAEDGEGIISFKLKRKKQRKAPREAAHGRPKGVPGPGPAPRDHPGAKARASAAKAAGAPPTTPSRSPLYSGGVVGEELPPGNGAEGEEEGPVEEDMGWKAKRIAREESLTRSMKPSRRACRGL
eukprot:jgi/Botrbrau1/11734/Bobra.0195s0061.1